MSDLGTLSREIKARQKLIESIVKFTERIIVKHGRVVKSSQGSCHTHTVWELKNLADFSFKADFGQTMMGGNDIYIWYRHDHIFHIYYQASLDECRVENFKQGDWVSAFKKLMRNSKKAVAQLDKQKTALQKKSEADLKEQEERKRLQNEAKRLGLS